MTYENDSSSADLLTPRGDGFGLPSWIIRALLRKCAHGHLTLDLPSGQRMTQHAREVGPIAAIAFRNWRTLRRVLLDGHLGFARSYIDGDWSTPDLKAFFEFCMQNEASVAVMADRWAATNFLNRLSHWRRQNSKCGSRRNIAAHYDLGNDFYAAWLDPAMNYSSALYSRPDDTLEQAQAAKLARVTDLLALRGGEHVLEIGFGWGALAQRIIEGHGCSVTGLTLSAAQLDFARARLQRSGSLARAHLDLRDYRDVDGKFDRIVSVEMLEAVGELYWPTFFAKLRACLKDGGNAVLQAITIDASRFEQYRRRPDFIQRYIFPGGMLPTVEIITREAQRAGLALKLHQPFGDSYVHTLIEWRARFERAWPQIAALGFDAPFKRMWEFYLAYCQIGFETGAIDVGFYKFEPC